MTVTQVVLGVLTSLYVSWLGLRRQMLRARRQEEIDSLREHVERMAEYQKELVAANEHGRELVPSCQHGRTEPVETVLGYVVARICLDCLEQLPPDPVACEHEWDDLYVFGSRVVEHRCGRCGTREKL